MNERPEAMFLPDEDGAALVPTLAAQGPWDPTTAHGGPIAALLAREVERAGPTEGGMRVARLTCDLFRPVPLQPLTLTHDVVRDGRQIRVVDALLWWDGRLVARASGLYVRVGHEIETDPERTAAAVGPPIEGPDTDPSGGLGPVDLGEFEPPGIFHAVELKRIVGNHGDGVPAVAWGRLTVPMVAGETTTPLQSLACIGDYSSGIGTYMDYRRYVSPNADLSYHLVRAPVGEWIGIDAATVLAEDGVGQSRSRLFDETGFVGTCATTLVVAPRP
jgi:hypothetical protein